MIITLNFIQWAVIIFYFLIGATLAIGLYLILVLAIATLIQGIKWLFKEDKKL